MTMLRSYLTTAVRSMRRQPGYALLNIAGLAVGFASALLILLFVRDELAYDTQHPDGVYRVTTNATTSGDVMRMAVTPAVHAPTMATVVPGIETFCRLHFAVESNLIRSGDDRFYEQGILFADATFFDVFGFPLASGDEAQALVEPFTVVLTPHLATRLFGAEDAVGRRVRFGDRHDYTVTGVLLEEPTQTHLRFSALLSFSTTEVLDHWYYGPKGAFLNSWHLGGTNSYVRLKEGVQPGDVALAMTSYVAGVLPETGPQYSYELQPVAEVHLRSDYQYDHFGGDNLASIYIFSIVAVFLLGIACINYMNLATARSTRRATEVGVRKVLGADRHQLAGQFLAESVTTAAMALGVALVLAATAMPAFNALAGKSFVAGDVVNASVLLWVVPVAVAVGLVAGGYPALILTRFEPARVLKRAPLSVRGGASLRRSLVVFQFAATFALLIGTGTVYRQLQHLGQMDLGFQRENLLFLYLPGATSPDEIGVAKARMEAHPRILGTAASSGIPVGPPARHDTQPGGRPRGERWLMTFYGVDYDFIETMGLQVVAGRPFREDVASDTLASYILNETAVARLGWEVDPIGRELTWIDPNEGPKPGRVVGVVRDFTYEGFRRPIEPAFLAIAPGFAKVITLRIAAEEQEEALAHVRHAWDDTFPDHPLEYVFLDEGWGQVVSSERRFGLVFASFALLTLFVACLGLFGLTSYAVEQRRKEVGVRKVMGASTADIVLLLTKDAVVLLGLAFALASPLAFLIMRRWLQEFEYQVDIGADVVVGAGLLAVIVAVTTVSSQALRAATSDPARSLRYE